MASDWIWSPRGRRSSAASPPAACGARVADGRCARVLTPACSAFPAAARLRVRKLITHCLWLRRRVRRLLSETGRRDRVNWTQNGKVVSTSASYTFTVPSANVTLTAHFK